MLSGILLPSLKHVVISSTTMAVTNDGTELVYDQHTSRTNAKVTRLMHDLLSVVQSMMTGVAAISLQSCPGDSGSMWTIQGSSDHPLLTLRYERETFFSGEQESRKKHTDRCEPTSCLKGAVSDPGNTLLFSTSDEDERPLLHNSVQCVLKEPRPESLRQHVRNDEARLHEPQQPLMPNYQIKDDLSDVEKRSCDVNQTSDLQNVNLGSLVKNTKTVDLDECSSANHDSQGAETSHHSELEQKDTCLDTASTDINCVGSFDSFPTIYMVKNSSDENRQIIDKPVQPTSNVSVQNQDCSSLTAYVQNLGDNSTTSCESMITCSETEVHQECNKLSNIAVKKCSVVLQKLNEVDLDLGFLSKDDSNTCQGITQRENYIKPSEFHLSVSEPTPDQLTNVPEIAVISTLEQSKLEFHNLKFEKGLDTISNGGLTESCRREKRSSCLHCKLSFPSKRALNSHRCMHKSKKIYTCSYCNLKFYFLPILKMHEKSHKQRPILPKEPSSQLEVILVEDQQSSNLQDQFSEDQHSGTSDFIAQTRSIQHFDKPLTEYAEPEIRFLQAHVDIPTHHPVKEFAINIKECSYCGKLCDRGRLKRHEMTHTGEKPYECSHCGRKFSQKANLKTHEMLHTGGERYPCPLCGKTFSLKGNLTKHLARHEGYKCWYCGESFGYKKILESHIKLHML